MTEVELNKLTINIMSPPLTKKKEEWVNIYSKKKPKVEVKKYGKEWKVWVTR
jgi:hypothetical protein